MSEGSHRTCEICGLKERHSDKQSYFARFPINEDRCREWIKVVGKEDLVYIPIEKLNELKHVCSNHFQKGDFRIKTGRLKMKAIPSKNLMLPPLPDDMLMGFPFHVFGSGTGQPEISQPPEQLEPELLRIIVSQPDSPNPVQPENINPIIDHDYQRKRLHSDHTYSKLSETSTDIKYNIVEKPVVIVENSGKKRKKKEIAASKATEDEDLDNTEELSDYIDLIVDEDNLGETGVDQEKYDGVDDAKQPKEDGPFSWQKFIEEAVPLDEKHCTEDVTFLSESQLVPLLCDPEEIQIQAEFSCNVCNEPITGFRYACVQCADWDLCGACEARGEHTTHYMLRVPPHRTPEETQRVLTALRQMLDGLALHEEPSVPVIKDEVKTEDPLCDDEAPQEPRAEPAGDDARPSDLSDPLALDPVANDNEIYGAEYLETENESQVPEIISIEDISAPQRNDDFKAQKTQVYVHRNVSVTPYEEANDLIALNRETGSYEAANRLIQKHNDNHNLIAPQTKTVVLDDNVNNIVLLQSPTESSLLVKHMMELSSLALDGQPLEVIDCSDANEAHYMILDEQILEVNNCLDANEAQYMTLDGQLLELTDNSDANKAQYITLDGQLLELTDNSDADKAQYIMTLDGQPLEVIDCSKDLRVNVT